MNIENAVSSSTRCRTCRAPSAGLCSPAWATGLKCLCLGDTRQVDNPYLNQENNGLKLGGQEVQGQQNLLPHRAEGREVPRSDHRPGDLDRPVSGGHSPGKPAEVVLIIGIFSCGSGFQPRYRRGNMPLPQEKNNFFGRRTDVRYCRRWGRTGRGYLCTLGRPTLQGSADRQAKICRAP